MKTLKISSLIIFLITLGSCADFPTKKFDMNFTVKLNVNTNTNSISSTEILKANTNSDFEKYSKKLNSIDIQRITYTVSSSSLPAGLVINSGKIEFAGKGGNVTLITMSNVDISGNLGKEVDFTLPNQSVTDEFGDLLKNAPNEATLYFTGSTNKGPLVAQVAIKFYTKATARIIGSN